MTDLRSRYEALASLSPDAPATAKRARGRELEVLLGEILEAESLDPRLRLRPDGEEIDGSFVLDGKVYLLEAKWHKDPLPASSVYAFKGKVDGKLVGTIGVFVSMSGFSTDAVDALTAGKDINVVLFDGSDLQATIEHGASRVLRSKLRAAAEQGSVFFPFTSLLAEVGAGGRTQAAETPTDATEDAARVEIIIICESATDVRVISALGQRVLEHAGLVATLRVVGAQGKQNMPRLANTLRTVTQPDTALLALIDGDRDPDATAALVAAASPSGAELIVVDPELDTWLAPWAVRPREALREAARQAQVPYEQHILDMSRDVDLDQLEQDDPSFRAFRETLVAAAASGTPDVPRAPSA